MPSELVLEKPTTTWTCAIPQFTPQVVIDQLRDGYWLESPDFNQDGKPDLIALASGIPIHIGNARRFVLSLRTTIGCPFRASSAIPATNISIMTGFGRPSRFYETRL